MWTTTVAAVVGLVLAPSLATADDVSEQLRLLQERLASMEDRLQATQDQLEDANGTLEAAGIGEERSAVSRLASFLEKTDFGGWAAASYSWNFNDPGQARNANTGAFSHAFHAQHNSIQFDEFALSIGQEATEESRGGFQFDILFGETANLMTTGNNDFGFNGTGASSLWVGQAYVEYLSPIGGVKVTAGKFFTHIGYEVVGAPLNANINRGFTWGLLQPISHTGIKFEGGCGDCGMWWLLGVANGFQERQPDNDARKDLLFGFGKDGEKTDVAINGSFGWDAESFRNLGLGTSQGGTLADWNPVTRAPHGDTQLVLDLIIEHQLSDASLVWLNVTSRQYFDHDQDPEPFLVGLNVGGRTQLNDRVAVATRFEWLRGDDDGTNDVFDARFPSLNSDCQATNGAFGCSSSGSPGASQFDVFGVTGTLDVALVDNLSFRTEFSWETIRTDGSSDRQLPRDNPGSHKAAKSQVIGTAQMIYEF